jgi:hypothetical protein
MNPDILTKEIINFIEGLRFAGYNIGAAQYVAAQDLLLTLAAQGKLPSELTELRLFLAPILCHSPKEQVEFQGHFDRWVSQVEVLNHIETKTTKEIKTPSENKVAKTETENKVNKRPTQFGKRLFIPVVVALVLISISIYWSDTTNLTSFTFDPYKAGTGYSIDEAIKLLEEQNNGFRPFDTSTVNELPHIPIQSKPQFNPQLFIWVILPLLLFILLLWKLWWKYRVQRFLKRQEASYCPDINQLPIKGIEKRLFQSDSLLRTAQQLHKHISIPSSQLDITTTIEKTLQAGCWFTPVTGTVKTRPEYLALIDRTTFNDHQTQLINSLINQLVADDVLVTRYYFDSVPRRCYPEQSQLAPLTLKELTERYPEHRLLVFSDGNGLINPITYQVNWIEQLSIWSHRVLFTLETPDQWGYREQILDEADFLIMSANEAGLTALAEQINTGTWQPYPKPSNSFSTTFPDYLNERPRRWLEHHAPDAPVVTELLKQVRDFLGDEGYYWFSACAVYPELRWPLTLYLGEQLKSLTEERLAKLARLPWFRYGYMPNWLREWILEDLSPYQKNEIHTTLQTFLQTALDKHSQDHLEIAKPKITLSNLIRQLLPTQRPPKGSPLRDYVFMTFMTNQLAVIIPKALNILLIKFNALKEYNTQHNTQVKAKLPSSLVLLWSLFMQPVTLHHRLKACGIKEPNALLLKLWHTVGENRTVKHQYVLKLITVLLWIIPLVTLFTLVLFNTLGYSIPFVTWAFAPLVIMLLAIIVCVVVSAVFGMVFGIAASIVVSVVIAVVFGMINGVVPEGLEGMTDIVITPSMGLFVGIIFGAVVGFYSGPRGMFYGIYNGGVIVAFSVFTFFGTVIRLPVSAILLIVIGMFVGLVFKMIESMIFGVTIGTVVDRAKGIVWGSVAVSLVFWDIGVSVLIYMIMTTPLIFKGLHTIFYPFEVIWQVICYILQNRFNYSTLRFVPVLYHNFSYLPHPFLAKHIILGAKTEPQTVKQVLDACAMAPGQERAWQVALSHLQAQELIMQVQQHQFAAIANFQSQWLSMAKGVETDSLSSLFVLRAIARYLQVVNTTTTTEKRLQYLEHADKLLAALNNHLLDVCSPSPFAYRSSVVCLPFDRAMKTTLPVWKAVIADLRSNILQHKR